MLRWASAAATSGADVSSVGVGSRHFGVGFQRPVRVQCYALFSLSDLLLNCESESKVHADSRLADLRGAGGVSAGDRARTMVCSVGGYHAPVSCCMTV